MQAPVTVRTHLLNGEILIYLLISTIFGAIGGAIGASVFKKGEEE